MGKIYSMCMEVLDIKALKKEDGKLLLSKKWAFLSIFLESSFYSQEELFKDGALSFLSSRRFYSILHTLGLSVSGCIVE